MAKKEPLSEKIEKLNLNTNINNLESCVKELGDSCILLMKNILRTNLQRGYPLLAFKKEMNIAYGDYPIIPELHILDKKSRKTIYELSFNYSHEAKLNEDYKGKLRKEGYLDSINKLLKSLGYKLNEESFSSKRGGCGGGCGG